MMKKVLAAMLMGAMLMSMTACGESEKTAKSSEITVISREDGSGTRGAFVELFGIQEEVDGEKVDQTTDHAQVTNSTSVMMTGVAQNPQAIGYISLGALDDSVKALKIDGAEASTENVKNESYPISRPFNIATRDKISEITQDFMDYIMSEEGQAIVEESGYIAAEEDVKPYEGNKPKGKVVVGGSSSVMPVMEKLKEGYEAINPDGEIEVQQSDSTTGMESALNGTYDIGMASRALKDSEVEKGLTGLQIALDGIAVIVNKENTLSDIASDQVKEIYTGEITEWGQLK